ncbi:hypothetical protein BgiBS90_032914, partial [Biomphalaria glabrata]
MLLQSCLLKIVKKIWRNIDNLQGEPESLTPTRNHRLAMTSISVALARSASQAQTILHRGADRPEVVCPHRCH